MAKEILVLHWTTNKSFKKGEIVLQKEGIFLYKTAKKILRGVEDFRDIVYAQIPLDVIDEIVVMKSGILKNHTLRLKIKDKAFNEILGEKHSGLFRVLVKLFNRKHNLYFPVLLNSFDEINNFVKITREHMK